MKKLEKKLLKYKLKKNNVSYKEEDLDEIIEIFNNLIDFTLESNNEPSYYRFGFVMTPNKYFELDDKEFFSIFKSIIKIKEKNLLNYLDYAILTYHFDNYMYKLSNLYSVSKYLKTLINEYNTVEYFIKDFINQYSSLIEYVTDNNMNIIQDSKYISNDYKAVIELYESLYRKYYDVWEEYYPDQDIYFEEVISLSYFYFVINNEFNNDIGHVFSFLNSIYQDMPGAIDKYNLIGETDDYVQVLNYIDSLYKSSKKMVKVIK